VPPKVLVEMIGPAGGKKRRNESRLQVSGFNSTMTTNTQEPKKNTLVPAGTKKRHTAKSNGVPARKRGG
jgi:hypothetical protein